ncbi:MAG: hypothetical protein AAB250_06330, partial [Bdellovibrionota bacterium]
MTQTLIAVGAACAIAVGLGRWTADSTPASPQRKPQAVRAVSSAAGISSIAGFEYFEFEEIVTGTPTCPELLEVGKATAEEPRTQSPVFGDSIENICWAGEGLEYSCLSFVERLSGFDLEHAIELVSRWCERGSLYACSTGRRMTDDIKFDQRIIAITDRKCEAKSDDGSCSLLELSIRRVEGTEAAKFFANDLCDRGDQSQCYTSLQLSLDDGSPS